MFVNVCYLSGWCKKGHRANKKGEHSVGLCSCVRRVRVFICSRSCATFFQVRSTIGQLELVELLMLTCLVCCFLLCCRLLLWVFDLFHFYVVPKKNCLIQKHLFELFFSLVSSTRVPVTYRTMLSADSNSFKKK